ncbi:MAG: FHA domain-containing protein [Woeseiaceae bacterium]|nr:FHA domain-containing protein [Woeseiaceae bacterium]
MELAAAGITEQPFRTHGRPLVFVTYQAQLAATEFLQATYRSSHGLGVFQGPSLSGKTTIIHDFVATLDDEVAWAVVDGNGVGARELLERILHAFDFDVELNSVNELLNVLRVYVLQQASTHQAPLVVIENTHGLHPDALDVVCELARLQVRSLSALRLVLASDRPIAGMVRAPALECIARRVTGTFNLAPMDIGESEVYLHSKLRAGGCDKPETVVPADVAAALYHASGGWPGIIDRLMLLALAKAETGPLTVDCIEKPVIPEVTGEPGGHTGRRQRKFREARLFLTFNGRTQREIPLDRPRVMIGRSEHNEIAISSKFVSRHHALFIRDGDITLLMDLNSTNGTFVNSRRISNHIMVHDDVVTVGHHGLKFVDPGARDSQPLEGSSFNDTVIMKSLDDMRRLLARENTQLLDLDDTGTNKAAGDK